MNKGSDAFILRLLIEGVEVADHLVEAGGIEMGVDLGGLDAGMPQQLLQHPQVGAAGMHVGGKGMTQHVRRDPIRSGQSGCDGRLLDLEQGRLARQGLGSVADRVEQPRLSGGWVFVARGDPPRRSAKA